MRLFEELCNNMKNNHGILNLNLVHTNKKH
jgi:hypothetical protein